MRETITALDSAPDDPIGPTRLLAEWSAGLRYAELPDGVRRAGRLLTLDGIGCGLFGATLPWAAIVRDSVEPAGSSGVRLWGSERRASATDAALVNGTAIHAFEFDDLHAEAVFHGCSQVLPTAFALAGAGNAVRAAGRAPDGRELLTAIVAGLEVGARIGLATGPGQLARGFHPSPNSGVFAAAATAASLLGLDATATQHALGIAASCGGSLMAAQYGAMVKRMHPGRAAQAGVQAAVLAERGFTGIPDALEAAYGGFASAYADRGPDQLQEVTADLGSSWEITQFTLKEYPCCGSNHTAIDAFTAIASAHRIDPDDIDHIDIRSSTLTFDHVGWPYTPTSVTAAQMNLAYTIAVLAIDGVVGPQQFSVDRINDPRVLALSQRVGVKPDSGIDQRGRSARHAITMTVHLRGGEQYSRSVERRRTAPVGAVSTDVVAAKYVAQARTVLSAPAVDATREAIMTLGEEADDGIALAELLAVL